MSSRMESTFARAKREGRAALVAYLCIGDPSLDASFAIARALLDAGVDAIELGAPFSDPMADGPVIARASARAIAAGSSMRKAIEFGAKLRQSSDAPLILFGYMNPIVVRGETATVDAVADAGIDAMLVVDMPPEEGGELRTRAKARAVDVIPLLTPTSGPHRIEAARRVGSGFAYYVSYTGVTGADREDPFDAAAAAAAQIREAMQLPTLIGFGIDSADKARRCIRRPDGSTGADGVIVGSAIVRAIENAQGDTQKAIDESLAVVRRIQAGLR